MVVFGQKWLYCGKRGCIRAKLFYSGKVVVFGQKWLHSGKVVEFGQSFGTLAKDVVIEQKWMSSSKSGSIRVKVVVFGEKLFLF